MTPGVHSRPFDDGSGRMVYFGHATEHFAHVVQLEGMQAGKILGDMTQRSAPFRTRISVRNGIGYVELGSAQSTSAK